MDVVTIHRGEIRQIKRMINESKLLSGNLYGLHSESKQPVVQIVSTSQEKIAEWISKEHGLLKIGEWSVKSKKSNDNLIDLEFNEKGQLCSVNLEGEPTKFEILKKADQSAFRVFPPVTDKLKKMTELDSKKLDASYDDVNDILPQWYSTSEGEKLFGQIHASLPMYGFKIQEMIRDTLTNDMTVLLKRHGDVDEVKLYFLHDFPTSDPKVNVGNQAVKTLRMEKNRETGKNVAELLCSGLAELIKQHAQREEHVSEDQINPEEKHEENNLLTASNARADTFNQEKPMEVE